VNLVVFDFETTGLSPERHEIIEIAAVRWEDGRLGERFHSLVRPERDIPDEVSRLTGITADTLADAPDLETVLPQFLAFIEGRVLAGHNVRFDLGFLQAACDQSGYILPTSNDALDTQLLSRVLFPRERDHRLEDLIQRFSIPVEARHRALEDAEATAAALTALCERAQSLPYLTLQVLTRLASLISGTTGAWFAEQAERRLQRYGHALPAECEATEQLVYSRPAGERETEPSDEADETRDERAETGDTGSDGADAEPSDTERRMATGDAQDAATDASWTAEASRLLAADSPLRTALPGFQARPGQQRMVAAVAKALAKDSHLLAEAGTGTGKSLAYLIPAALYATAHDKRVLISTHTIALQDQIAARDFPTLRRVIQRPLKLAVFKGRTHYICMRKLRQETANLGWASPADEVVAYMRLLTWLVTTPAGSREELAMTGADNQVWPRVQSESETCINKRCQFFKPCYYFRARTAAYNADLVVTNHALVFTDLKSDHRVLPQYDRLIVDEAHHLEEEATRQLGEEARSAHLAALFARLVRDRGRQGVLPELQQRLTETGKGSAVEDVAVLMELCDELRAAFDAAFTALGELLPREHGEMRITADVTASETWSRFEASVDQLKESWGRVEPVLNRLADVAEAVDDELGGRLQDAVGFFPAIAQAIQTLEAALVFDENWVTWIERATDASSARASGPRGINLYRTPLDVAPILAERLFDKKATVVLTSATLSVEGRFDFVKSRLGLKEAAAAGRLDEVRVSSPFDLGRQALLCVPNDVPELAKMVPEEAAVWLTDSIYQLTKASGGRVLVLFTSHALLRATAQALRDPLSQAGYELLAQGMDGNRTRLLSAFRNLENGVLLGAQSFWEGIDLPGDQLRTLVIVRLPFAPPTHPVTQARHERIEQHGRSAFWHASLPEAVVRFRQGFGRLIRTTSDRGVVVVYDKRIVQSRYGRSFLRSVDGVRPYVAPEAAVMERVRAFFATVDTCSASRSAH
jgi:ATP-dependent DNA helicase DinG